MNLLDKAVFASTSWLGMKTRMSAVKKYNVWKRGDLLERRRAYYRKWRAAHPSSSDVRLQDGYALDFTCSLPHLDQMLADARCIVREERQPVPKGKDYLVNHLTHDDLQRFPSFLDFATSDEVVAIAGDYLGMVPVLSVIELWKSPPQDRPEDVGSMLFHLDNADDRQVKMFVNLHDIDLDTGPFAFLPADVSARVCGHVGYGKVSGVDRLNDEQVFALASENDLKVCAYPKGTVLFVDTISCLHYGSRGNAKPRYVLMCQYLSPCRADFRAPSLRSLIRPQDSEARQYLLDCDH